MNKFRQNQFEPKYTLNVLDKITNNSWKKNCTIGKKNTLWLLLRWVGRAQIGASKAKMDLGVVGYACSPSTWEAEARGWLVGRPCLKKSLRT
jgi:hypothetical protein